MIKNDQPTIFDASKVLVAVSSVADGNMKYEYDQTEAETAKNMATFCQSVGINPENGVVMLIDKSSDFETIREVTAADCGGGMQSAETRVRGDVFVTREPNVALILPTADCHPVVLHDPVKNVLALAHLGRQSAVLDMAKRTVDYLVQNYQTDPADLLAYLAPTIKKESYQLEYLPEIVTKNTAWQPFVEEVAGGFLLDVAGYNRQGLLSAGVLAEHIELCPVDTATSKDYFSHYASTRPDYNRPIGRFITVCQLR